MSANLIHTSKYDYKTERYEQDLKGWKVLGNELVHSQDVGLNGVKKVLKDGKMKYDSGKIKVALFGLGRIGTIRFESLITNPRVKVLYCVESCTQRANYVQCRWHVEDEVQVLHPNEADNVYKDPRVDAVFVCTPTLTHKDIVMKALEAGKAVFCEKPLAHTYEETETCYKLADQAKLPILCAYNRRFDPGYVQIRQRVSSGEVGQVHVIKTCSRDPPNFSIEFLKTSGGIYHDCVAHDIDIICWLIGDYPVSVSSQATAFNKEIAAIGDFDTVAITMKFPNGAIGIIDVSRHAVYGLDQRVEVFGSKGMLTSGQVRPTSVVNHSSQGSTMVPICYSFASRYADAYSYEVEHFLDAFQGLCRLDVTGEQTLAVTRIASACEESARTGNTVQLSWK